MWGRPDYDPRTPEQRRRLFWGIVIFIVASILLTAAAEFLSFFMAPLWGPGL